MKNRSALILSLLSANQRFGGEPVQRTALVKQAFLAEVIRPLYKIWIRTFAFVRYYYGPYSDDIFDKLNTLIFNGLVRVTAYTRLTSRTEARYQITDSGVLLVNRIVPSDVQNLTLDLIWALQAMGAEQSSALCKIVYQEAEFARIFSLHNLQGIGPETRVNLPVVTDANNKTFIALSVMQEITKHPNDSNSNGLLSTRDVVLIYLQYLSSSATTINRPQRST